MPVKLRVRELADELGMNIRTLANQAGISYNSAHALYNGHVSRVDLDTLDRLCDVLKVEPGDLFIRIPGERGDRSKYIAPRE